jgi:uncharacterized protein YktA (UPF0223 family)
MSTSKVDTWSTVSFWMENLIEVPIQFFSKIEVPYVTQIETQELKNKVMKTQRPYEYLTLQFIHFK